LLTVVLTVCIGLCYWTNHYLKQKKNDADKYLGKNREVGTVKQAYVEKKEKEETSQDRVKSLFEAK
jgi:hypothetical protein